MKKVLLIFSVIVFASISFILAHIYMTKQERTEIPLETKIGQMIVIGYTEDDKILDDVYNDIQHNRISGIIFYKRNIKSPQKIQRKIDKFNNISTLHPLFIMVDQEGGLVSRIADDNGFKTYPSAQDIAKNYTPDEAYKTYFNMAKDLHNVGFNFNLAPCVDIKTNPDSNIGKQLRTYGSDSQTVSKYAYEFVRAHNQNNVITSLKHFPGIGNASLDSHKTLPDITNSWNEKELEPFKNIIKEFPDEPIMVGHVINKNLDSNKISSNSVKIINILKNMNHTGVILTDAIDMDAVDGCSTEDVIIDAINAGIDLFIFPNHTYYQNEPKKYMRPEWFINIVLNAIRDGKIDIDRINASYTKIINLKQNNRKNIYE